MKIYPLPHVIDFAREHSPYYRDLYKDLGSNPTLEELPLVVQSDFWAAMNGTKGKIPTGVQMDGQVFKSGGTTGSPKYAMYSADEWRTMCELTGFYSSLGGLKYGDRVANLFYGGGMYASFLYSYSIFYFSPAPVVQFSLSGNLPPEELADALVEHRITTIAGVPSLLMKTIQCVGNLKEADRCIETVYFAGETLYPDQRRKIRDILGEHIDFRSMSYASNDGGIIGYYHSDCGFNEHRTMDMACKLELIDPDSGSVIREPGRPGKVYITSLYRLLMPIIRYPAGDLAEYVDPEGTPDRRFRLLGRSEEAARVGYVSIYPEDVVDILKEHGIDFDAIQIITTRKNGKDRLTIRIGSSLSQPERDTDMLHSLCERRPMLKEACEKGVIGETTVEWRRLADLEFNRRTGKCLRVIDRRME